MTRTIFIAAALALAVTLPAIPAQALVTRTFLSAAGSDGNNCANVLTPCRHLATAFAATAQDGEIYVLDPANYGSLTITHGVSIEGHGWASIAPPGMFSSAITINANPGDKINIIGVVLDGTGIFNTTGIQFNSGGSLTVRDSVIRNFQDGIDFGGIASTPSQLFVSNTLVSDNGNNGIEISPAGTGNVTGTLDRVAMKNNVTNGLVVTTTNQTVNVTVSDSVSTNNGSSGIVSQPTDGTASVMVRNSTITNNTNNGLLVNGTGCSGLGSPNAIIRVTRSTITGNATGWLNSGCGAVLTFGDNDIFGNGSANNAPTSISHE